MLFKTHDMENTIRTLHGYYHRILVRNAYVVPFRVRLRMKLLADIAPYIGRRTGSDEQISRWRERGGVLISCDPELKNTTHQAEVRCEAPFSMVQIDSLSIPIVVYVPPSWRGHEEAMPRVAPSAALGRRFLELVRGAGLSAAHAAICEKLGFSSEGVTALTDDELAERMGLVRIEALRVRRHCMRGIRAMAFGVTPIVVNVPPADRTLLPIYEAVCALPQIDNVRLAFKGELYEAALYWRKMLRRLERCGSVSVRPRITFYATEEINPDFDRLEDEHAEACSALAEVIRSVDAAPEFSLDRLMDSLLSRPAPLPPSGAPEQRAA